MVPSPNFSQKGPHCGVGEDGVMDLLHERSDAHSAHIFDFDVEIEKYKSNHAYHAKHAKHASVHGRCMVNAWWGIDK